MRRRLYQNFPEKKYHNIRLLVNQLVSYDISYDIMIFPDLEYALYVKRHTPSGGMYATASRMWTIMSRCLHVHVPSASSTHGTGECHAWTWPVPRMELG